MRVLISGLTGNIGSACHERARMLGWDVVGISKHTNLDLRDWDATNQFIVRQVPFDLVICAHGWHHIDRVADLAPETWHKIIDNNATASAALSHALLKYNKLKAGGLIIYCTSIQGSHTRAGRGAYSAAKNAEEGLMLAVAAEIGPERRALCIRMGQLETQMHSINLPVEEVKRLQARCYTPWVPVGEVAQLCFELYDLKSMTGTCIELDSGQSKNIW